MTTEINTASEAYNTGFEAAKQGEPRTACPYAAGTWDADNWLAGWTDRDNRCHVTFVICHEQYGDETEFDSLDEAQQAIRDCGPDFAGTTLRRTSDNLIRNERDEIVGDVQFNWPA